MTIARVIDFETTGLEPPFQVCEVGICDVDVDARTVGDYSSWLCGVDVMPPEVRAIHHIDKSECDGKPIFNDIDLYNGATVMVAHNAEFELKFTKPNIPVICTYKAALRVWPDAPSHSNSVLRYWLQDQGKINPDDEKTHPVHRAGPDTYVTAWLLVALLNDGATGKDMVKWTKEPRLLSKCPIGKFRGVVWSDVELGFLNWMVKQVDMDYDLKWNAMREIKLRSGE